MDSSGEQMINMLMNAKQTIMNNNDDLNRLIKQVNSNINDENDCSNMMIMMMNEDEEENDEIMADIMFDSESSSEDGNNDTYDNHQIMVSG
jgi:hypothetical protein